LAQYATAGRTAHTSKMDTRPSALRSFTSAKGRSFRLSYAEMAAGSTGWIDRVDWICSRIDRSQLCFSIFGEAEEGWLRRRWAITKSAGLRSLWSDCEYRLSCDV
jgi:hypothetical protein